MNTEKMTVHRALAELKTLDARIKKEILSNNFVVTNRHSNTKIDGVSIDKFNENILATFTKINDLISRRNAMKRAITLSNAVTKVVIGGVEYTVAEAIGMKQCGMDNIHNFMAVLTEQKNNAVKLSITKNGDSLNDRADEYVTGLFGNKDKTNQDDITAARDMYIKANTIDIIDPIGVDKVVADMKDYYDGFMTEVDACLSVSNAVTVIEFSY